MNKGHIRKYIDIIIYTHINKQSFKPGRTWLGLVLPLFKIGLYSTLMFYRL